MRKFYYAFSGLFHGITHDASIALQCILGIIALAVFAFFRFNSNRMDRGDHTYCPGDYFRICE